MNIVLDEAEEVSMKKKTRKPLGAHMPTFTLAQRSFTYCIASPPELPRVCSAGRILLKGDNITLMQTT